jgi:hypothetical protein
MQADDLAFGVDLLLPQLGGNARKTNYDYTKGKLMDLIDVIIEEKTKLFICAVGVPPKEVVEKLHKAGILVMNVSPLSHLSDSCADGERWSELRNMFRKPLTKVWISSVPRVEREVVILVLRLLRSSSPHVSISARTRFPL